jgi:hypothetical protein
MQAATAETSRGRDLFADVPGLEVAEAARHPHFAIA